MFTAAPLSRSVGQPKRTNFWTATTLSAALQRAQNRLALSRSLAAALVPLSLAPVPFLHVSCTPSPATPLAHHGTIIFVPIFPPHPASSCPFFGPEEREPAGFVRPSLRQSCRMLAGCILAGLCLRGWTGRATPEAETDSDGWLIRRRFDASWSWAESPRPTARSPQSTESDDEGVPVTFPERPAPGLTPACTKRYRNASWPVERAAGSQGRGDAAAGSSIPLRVRL